MIVKMGRERNSGRNEPTPSHNTSEENGIEMIQLNRNGERAVVQQDTSNNTSNSFR
jgi:hypothetical protein